MRLYRLSLAARKLTLAAFALGSAVTWAADPKEFKIGGVVAFSGTYGIMGDAMKKGAELAAERHGGKVLGAPIKFLWEDSEAKPQAAVNKTQKVLAEGAELLFGEVSSGSTLAMMKLAERRRVPLLVTLSGSDDITGSAKNDYTFRTSNSVTMENRLMAEFAAKKGLKRIYGVVADYGVGHVMWQSLRKMLEEKGISIVGEDFPPLGNVDYSVIIDKVSKSNADGVAMIILGGDAITFLKQAGPVGLKDKKALFGTAIMDELSGQAVGDFSYGVSSTLRYHFSQDNPANHAFVAAYRKKYGEYPSQFAGEAYDGMAWMLKVIEQTRSRDPEVWIRAFRNSTYRESIEGVKQMRPCDNQAAQVGLFGTATRGTPPLPAVTMTITHTIPVEALFSPCKG